MTSPERDEQKLAAAALDMLVALHNATEFLNFYFISHGASQHRASEGVKNMRAEAVAAVRVAKEALAKAEALGVKHHRQSHPINREAAE